METLYEHADGDDGLHRLEELFYAKALADPVLKTLFTMRVPTHVDHLTWFTAESFGGPDRFSRELGFQYIIDVHRHLDITDEQWLAWLEATDIEEDPEQGPRLAQWRTHPVGSVLGAAMLGLHNGAVPQSPRGPVVAKHRKT